MICFSSKVADVSDQKVYHLLEANELLNGSDMMAAFMPCIQISTIYKNLQSTAHHDATISKMKTRMLQILEANKWLMGRIRHVYKEDPEMGKDGVKRKSIGGNAPILAADNKKTKPKKVLALCVDLHENPENYIKTTINNELFKKDNYTHYTDIIKKFDLGSAGQAFNKDEGRLFEFGIIYNEEKTHFCIYVCINHMIADGCTMFRIYKQLDFENVEVFSMNANRVEGYDENIGETSLIPVGVSSKEALSTYMNSTMWPQIKLGIKQKFKGKQLKQFLYKFDTEEIKRRKEASQAECQQLGLNFVSSNDVILSWFASITKNKKCDNLFIPINVRERIKGVDANRAGMYLSMPIFKKENLATPAKVRHHLNGLLRPDRSYEWHLPTQESLNKYIGGAATNWTSFYHHVEPSGFEQVLHFPVEAEMEGNGGGSWMGQAIDMVIFQANKETTACLIWGKRDELTQEMLEKEPILSGKLCDI